MLVENPKFRKSLSKNQVKLLEVLYKFRYGSTDLVSEMVSKDRSTIYESFYILGKQGYIHKLYDSSYRLPGRPAIYCLASKGLKYLRDNTELDKTTLRNFYKNKTMRVEHIDHCLNVFTIFLTLKRHTGKKFYIYTKYELIREAFPKPLPELYLVRRDNSDKPSYMLDIFAPGTFTWLLRKRISQHQDLSEEDSEFYAVYPNVLLIAQNESTERRLFKLTYENYYDLNFYLTQQDILLNSKDGEVWIDMSGAEEDEIIRVAL